MLAVSGQIAPKVHITRNGQLRKSDRGLCAPALIALRSFHLPQKTLTMILLVQRLAAIHPFIYG